MAPSPSETDRLSMTEIGTRDDREDAAISALWKVADSAPERLIMTTPVAPCDTAVRMACSKRPGEGAAVDGRTDDAEQRAQNSAVVNCSRSTYSSSPKRMKRGTTSMPRERTTSSGRSQELSVMIRTLATDAG